VLATQTLVQKKAKNFRINVNGQLPLGVTSKDVILQIIGIVLKLTLMQVLIKSLI